MNKQPALCIVPVVCGVEMTRRCINSLLAQDIEPHVFAIDNGSRDGCSTLLRSYGSKISRITHLQTISLNKVWNDALDMAFRSLKLEHALMVNNDTELLPQTYRYLLEDRGEFVTGVGVDRWEEGKDGISVSSRSPHPSFSCFLIRRSVWTEVGPFNEQYHAYCSDADYHLRMDQAGIDAYSIGVPFLHVGSGTLKQLAEDDYDRHKLICAQSDEDRALFITQYGFSVGSDAYYESFRKPMENVYAKKGTLA